MKQTIYLKRILWAVVISVMSSSAPVFAATFPTVQDFSGTQPADWELRGSATWNTAVVGSQTLQLTPALTSQAGLGFYNDAFPSNLGVVAEFRYYSGGGTGADGLAFFLVNGDLVDENNIAAGALGGALGYAQSTTTSVSGIPHAYLGVGFDEFGNFITNSGGMDPGSPTPIPDSVVLRGSGNGLVGYDYLTHRDVFADFGERIDGGWRVVRVTVVPQVSSAIIQVEMSWDEGQTWRSIIDNYVYNEAPPANLKLGFTAGTGGSTNIHAIDNLNLNLPVDLDLTLITPPAGTYERGDTITYAYTVENQGPNDSASTTITNTIPLGPLGIENLTWSLTSTHGSSSSGTGANFDQIVIGIPDGETVTVRATGTIGMSILNTTDLDHVITAVPESSKKDPSPADSVQVVSITTDAPTASASALLKILTYIQSNGTTSVPTSNDYTIAGITGVSNANLSVINTLLLGSGATTDTEIQAIITAATTVVVYATSGGTTTVPTVNDYALARIDDVTPRTIDTVNAAVARSGLTTLADIRDFVANLFRDRSGIATRRVVSLDTNQNISALQAQLARLREQLAALQGGVSPTVTATPTLAVRDLTGGMTGEDVRRLQTLLIAKGYSINAGPTGYFGSQTRAALAQYQSDFGISPAQGYFGERTRAQMKAAGLADLWW